MKSTGICPKCSSKKINVIPSKRGTNNWGKIDLLAFVKLTRHMCASCGYMEQYIDGEMSFLKLRRKVEGA